MAARAPRERITVDLSGLGSALRAEARAHNLSVAMLARMTLAARLGPLSARYRDPEGQAPERIPRQTIKVTLRVRPGVASALAGRARACGISSGAYLSSLVEGTPAVPLAPDHQEAVAALNASTDRLATVLAELRQICRLMTSGDTKNRPPLDRLQSLADEVRLHLRAASGLASELKPCAMRAARVAFALDEAKRSSS